MSTNPGRRWASRPATLTLACSRAVTAPPLSVTTTRQKLRIATPRGGRHARSLAKAYLDAPRQWPLLQARNKVANPRQLQPGSVVWIPVRLQPAESATVDFVHGQVTAQGQSNGTAGPVLKGGRLDEGTVLQVGPDAFVAVRLADGTVVRVQAQSELQLRQLRRRAARAAAVCAGDAQRRLESIGATKAEAFSRAGSSCAPRRL